MSEVNSKLTPRQQRVIELVAQGLKNREIAKKLGIAEQVVRNYLGNIYDKVGVRNRVELAQWYETRVHEGKFPQTQEKLTASPTISFICKADTAGHLGHRITASAKCPSELDKIPT